MTTEPPLSSNNASQPVIETTKETAATSFTDSKTDSKIFDEEQLRNQIAALILTHGHDANTLRTAIIAQLKAAIKTTFAKAQQQLSESNEGLVCAAQLSDFCDLLIAIAYDLTRVDVFRTDQPLAPHKITIIATGGYGRGLMAPGSDIDLLFIHHNKQVCEANQKNIEFILYLLWDLGFKVGHATRSISQCIQHAKNDYTIRTALLDSRLLLGDQELFDRFYQRFLNEVVHKTGREFIEAKLQERDIRHKRAGSSRYLVEPNVKDGKGGLRDLHTLHWLVKYLHPHLSPDEWVAAGIFSADEFETYRICEDFLWAVRCNLHFAAGKAEERLSFDMQPVLAERMNYCGDDHLSAVERFMKHYFGVAKAVGDLTRIVCAVLEYNELRDAPRLHRLLHNIQWPERKIEIDSDDFQIQHGRLNITSKDVFKHDPVNLIRIFALAEQHDVELHPIALRQAHADSVLINDDLRTDPEANRLFLNLLTSPANAEKSLRLMNEAGVLGQFIPDFGRIVAMMQFNMYHHFTVDEHLIQAVGIVSDIDSGNLAEDHPLSTEIMKTIENTRILYVAVLLHDIAKGRDEDHSIAGARIARTLCPRLGMTKAETETVAWLIEQHLVMSHFAQTRDVHDPKTAKDFAAIVQSPERLKLLLVLTVADIRAVGPGVWTGWKGQLLRDLYYETMPLLTGGHTKIDIGNRAANAQRKLREALAGWDDHEFDAFVKRLYPPYWLKTDTERQKIHFELMRKANRERLPFVSHVNTDDFTEMTDISIFTQYHPRLAERIAGACAVSGANIVAAQISTTRDGLALNTFTVQRDFPLKEDELRRAERITDIVDKLMRGEVQLGGLLAAKERSSPQITAFTVEPQINIDNTLSENQTVIEVNGLDRIGLLFELTRALFDLQIVLKSAHITTFGEKAVDVFYVTDILGEKIRDTKRHDNIRNRLYPVLRNEMVE